MIDLAITNCWFHYSCTDTWYYVIMMSQWMTLGGWNRSKALAEQRSGMHR